MQTLRLGGQLPRGKNERDPCADRCHEASEKGEGQCVHFYDTQKLIMLNR